MADIKTIRNAGLLLFCVFLICGCPQKKDKEIENEFSAGGSELRKFELQQKLTKRYSDPELHYELGKIYQSEGLWDKAIFEFDIAKSYDPVHWESAAAIVKTLYQNGKKDRAVFMAERYARQAAFSASHSLSLGKAFQNETLDDEALVCYTQALEIAPNSAELNKQVGYYYQEKNDLIRAEQYFRRSFEIDPSPEVGAALGSLGIKVERPESPLKESEINNSPEDVK